MILWVVVAMILAVSVVILSVSPDARGGAVAAIMAASVVLSGMGKNPEIEIWGNASALGASVFVDGTRCGMFGEENTVAGDSGRMEFRLTHRMSLRDSHEVVVVLRGGDSLRTVGMVDRSMGILVLPDKRRIAGLM